MKIKNILLALNFLMLLFSLSQIFSIPPYAGDIFQIYKSGYFSEIDKGFKLVIDSFTAVKTNGRTEAGWIFLNDIEKSAEIKAHVYNKKGQRVIAPSYYENSKNHDILKIINSVNPRKESISLSDGVYRSVIPAIAGKKCLICHSSFRENDVIGAFYFERKFDAHIYYTSERIIIFLLISLLLLAMLVLTARWDPEREIKELFDKKK